MLKDGVILGADTRATEVCSLYDVAVQIAADVMQQMCTQDFSNVFKFPYTS